MPTEDELREWFQAEENASPQPPAGRGHGHPAQQAPAAAQPARRGRRLTLAVAGISVGSIAGIRSILPGAAHGLLAEQRRRD